MKVDPVIGRSPAAAAATAGTVEALAPVLRLTKGQFLAASGRPDALAQPGAAVLPAPFVVPLASAGDPVEPREGEACLETFVVQSGDGAVGGLGIEPTGVDVAVAAWWRPTVEALVERVRASMSEVGVELRFPHYVTVSTTPIGAVAASPHLDDDQTDVGSGVGIVALAGSHLGPRVVRGVIGCRGLAPPAPIEPAPDALDAFAGGSGPMAASAAVIEQFPADRVAIFSRFGQLHAGPALPEEASGIRSLLVLRADTVPATGGP